MLRRHLPTIAAIDQCPALAYRVRQYFQLGSRLLIIELPQAGLSQADLVLALMSFNTERSRAFAESLVGRPIQVLPSCRLSWSFNKQTPSVSTQPTITHVMSAGDVPLRRGTRLAMCFAEFKRGRTLQQLQMRGVSRGDIRRAMKRGWIKVVGVRQ
jgi:hypothetical protein